MRTPNLNSLRVFDAAARHLNFRLAADELNVTQGAVAQQVRRLEQDLGFKLFHRKARGLAFTELGRNYHGPIRQALSIIDDATEKLKPRNTTLRISVTPSFAAKWLVPRLKLFQQAHPNINVQTVATEGLADFKTDGVDLAIRQGEPPFGDNTEVALLAPLDLRAVCNATYAKKHKSVERIEDFTKHYLIQDGHRLWDRLFEEAGLKALSQALEFNQTSLAMEAAANGQGVALVPALLTLSDLEQGKLVEVWRPEVDELTGYYILSPKLRQPKAIVEIMREWCIREVSQMFTASEPTEAKR